ncbi:hypothetical protein AXK12_08245 [Cephaloticoccus capnophilus]|uniref:Preprotein translocase subunit SecD n=1 Tax=Cephaloticoccus capnophilus TaxID=1548208 RepID=A0A139SHL5_9BACT|nr:hypothetical protein [Cephaloticoccus capnophilus]KXU34011.1 hypothetical protein AXK12_08245 [Cephaloticoccus capnophilus]
MSSSLRAAPLSLLALAAVLVFAGLGSGCVLWTKPPPQPGAHAWFLLEADAEQEGVPLVLPVSGVAIRVAPKPVISEFDIVEAAVVEVDLGRCLGLRLTGEAARDLYRMSVSQMGRRLVLLVNGQALGARVIDGAIEGGVLFVFVEVADEELHALAREINTFAAAISAAKAKAK